MVRWSMALATVLGVLAISIGVILWVVQANDGVIEALRQTHVVHQQLQQKFTVLQSDEHVQQLEQLDQGLDALQIRLAEVISERPLPLGVVDVTFEQLVLPQMIDAGTSYPVSVLRLSLNLTIEHSLGLASMLDRVSGAMATWPFEVRGCQVQRLAVKNLNAHCVLDFYHWSDEAAVQGIQPDLHGNIGGGNS